VLSFSPAKFGAHYKNAIISIFLALWQNCENQLLALLCQFVCPSEWNNSAPNGQIVMKFDAGTFFENLSRKFKFSLILDNDNAYFT